MIFALLISWAAFQWQLQESHQANGSECSVPCTGECLTTFWKSRYPSETGLCSDSCPWCWLRMRLPVFSMPVQKSFWHLASFRSAPFNTCASASPSFTAHSFFPHFTFTVSPGPRLSYPHPPSLPPSLMRHSPALWTGCSAVTK